ncbi:NUDIX domain-containing protein [Kribbella sp. HUAS MG21]|uniref:NUDIX domain-containing protein n=1 Tax=Kribbella sp. HUAS MG21 TaxID=3160966 RepID=A0AAU7TE01_9ACTN
MHHFGVYARIGDAAHVLLVRKTRGPYTGLLDLPGGTPEPGETWAETLERELHEELGLHLTPTGAFKHFAVHVHQSSTGTPISLHHRGVYVDVHLPAGLQLAAGSADVTSPDTAGSAWFDLQTGDPAHLSSAARAVLPL